MKTISKIVETAVSTNGLNMTIVEYFSHNHITVQFEDNSKKIMSYHRFKSDIEH